jgi:hypothetical protein
MNWTVFKAAFVGFAILILGALILTGSGLSATARGPDWKWDSSLIKNFRPGIAFETDTLLAVFQKAKLQAFLDKNLVKDATASPPSRLTSFKVWLQRFAEQVTTEFRNTEYRKNERIGNSFTIVLDKEFSLTWTVAPPAGVITPEVCNNNKELVRFRIVSKTIDLTKPIEDTDTERMKLISDIVSAAEKALVKVGNDQVVPKGSGIFATNFISFPLPNGSQVPNPDGNEPPSVTNEHWAQNAVHAPTKEGLKLLPLHEVIVAVLDTGPIDPQVNQGPLDQTCENFIEENKPCRDGYGRDGKDIFKLPENKFVGHGAGVGAIINDSKYGIAPGVGVKHVQVCAYDNVFGGFKCPTEKVVQALCKVPSMELYPRSLDERAIHPKIINLSFGSVFPSKIIQSTLEDLANANILVVTAAGNTRNEAYKKVLIDTSKFDPKAGMPMYPAAYASSDRPLAVAVGTTDENGNYANFSTVNSYVTLAAPGVGVTTALSKSNLSKTKPYNYGQFTGTSFSTPFVSGAAAILIAQYQKLHAGSGSSLSRDKIIQYLKNSSLPKVTCPIPEQSGQCGRQLDISLLLALVQ